MFKAVGFYMMRLFPWFWVRFLVANLIARVIAWLHPMPSGANELQIVYPDSTEILNREGWVQLEPMLSESQINDIVNILEKTPLISKGQLFLAREVPNNIRWARYSRQAILACPHIIELMNDPRVLRVVHSYLGCKPTISDVAVDWSFAATGEAVDVQRFHRDPDEWRFVKLFIYLTDIDEGSGPHRFVSGSHRSSGRLFSTPYTEGEIEYLFGRNKIETRLGPKGTTFLEDTWGIHKGEIPITRSRLLLQIQYSMLPILKFSYEPVSIPNALRFDRYSNRLLFF